MHADLPPDQRLAEGFARHVRRWAHECGASEAAAAIAGEAARRVSLATAAGHVCAHLDELPAGPTAPRGLLLASGVVGTETAPGAMPLILDAAGRLYLHRYFDYERRLARRLRQAAAPAIAGPAPEALKASLERLFAGNAARLAGRPDWQKLAAALALLNRLTVISGGPGTGKTTTVVNLLACLIEATPACRIALAAPTGKAAARMIEALRQRALHLPAAIQARLPTQAHTIHRLLGMRPGDAQPRHHAGNSLAIDALVVDEASMLDLALATRLLAAVPPAARIVLLGDKDQLAAVEAGAVFAELSADPTLTPGRIQALAGLTGTPEAAIRVPARGMDGPSPDGGGADARPGLNDCVVWFTDNYRFARDSGIGRLAGDIRAGRAPEALDWLRHGTDAGVAWLEEAAPAPGEAARARILAGYADYCAALEARPGDPAAVTAAFNRFRVLCALREGPRGVAAVNEWVGRQLRRAPGQAGGPAHDADWYPGRPLMVRRNDYLLRLYNGDIGIVLPDAAGALMAWFPDGDQGFRAVAPGRLPEHETAFAMTVHKSQGSEFDAVLLMLPAEPGPLLTRELLYTGITRARDRVTLVGGAPVLEHAIRTPTRRHSGLIERLRE